MNQRMFFEADQENLKAALINIFIFAMDQMHLCDVKVVAPSDKPTDYHDPTLPFSLGIQGVLASFSSLFWFSGP